MSDENPPALEPGQFHAFLVTGDTYPARHDLRHCGGRFDREAGGYVLPCASADQITRLAEAHRLSWGMVVVDYDPLVPETPEQRLARRQEARLRRADRLESQAGTRARDAAAARAKHKPFTSDWQFLTQPILVGHHSEGRHRRLWDKIDAAREAEMRNASEAAALQARADHLRAVPIPVAGDAARRKAARVAAVEAQGIRVGSIIHCPMFGQGKVLRVNKETYTVLFDRGFTQKTDKAYVSLVRQDDTPPPPPAFRKGDRVMAVVFYGHSKPRPGTVQRRTSRGFSVLIDGETEVRSLDADRLSPMPAEAGASQT